eukprot:jgi/Mesen1/8190/ME000044S07461
MVLDGKICAVTGGRGFVARHLVSKLLEKGGWTVRILDLAPDARLTDAERDGPLGAALASGRAKYMRCDIREMDQLVQAFEGASVVFHVAAATEVHRDQLLQYAINVTGTRNVIDACVTAGVPKLVFTSSASVVCDGVTDIKEGDESLPYPDVPMDFYTETKAQAESLVLAANGRPLAARAAAGAAGADKGEGGPALEAGPRLLTCALRPSGVFGPGEALMVPTTIKKARQGMLKFTFGDGKNMMDWTFVENVAHAHLCAEQALTPGNAEGEDSPAGKAFFITNGQPRNFWDFIIAIMVGLGYDRPKGKLPAQLVLALAHVNARVQKLLAPLGMPPSDFTPSRIRIATKWRVYSSARAARMLGYAPVVPLDEGIRRCIAAFQHLSKPVLDREAALTQRPSQVHVRLGGGLAADVALWRDPKKTALAIVLFYLIFKALFTPGLSLVRVLAHLALLAAALLFASAHARPLLHKLNVRLPQVRPSWEVSEARVASVSRQVAQAWNGAVRPHLQRLLVDRDPVLFLSVVVTLVLVRWLSLGLQTSTLVATAMGAVFVLPPLFERYESQIESLVAKSSREVDALTRRVRGAAKTSPFTSVKTD